MVKFVKRQTSKASISNYEVPMADFIPYYCHWDKETIMTKDRELLQIIRVDGFSFETADDEDVDMKKMVRNSLFKSLASGSFGLYFHTIRRRQSMFPGGRMPPGFAEYVNELWKRKHHSRNSYSNDLYITIVRKADKAGAAKIEWMSRQLIEKADRASRDEALKEAHKELVEVVNRVVTSMRDYSPHLLSVVETDVGAFSEPLEFLGTLVNGGASQPILVPTMDISHLLPTRRLYFGKRAIEMRGPTGRKYAGIVSVKEYSAATAAGILDSFLQLPFEFIISQSFLFENRQTNIESMQRQQRKMIQSEDVAVSQVAEISEALDMTMSGHVSFGQHHLTVLCIEESLPALEDTLSLAISELVNVGINPVREKAFMEAAYWAQLPANMEYIGRKAMINSMNLAGFASLHNYPTGRIRNNHWGDAITVLDTSSGTPYFFNFHLRDVGHTTIIGPTGAGKTVLMNFLCAQAQKVNCRMFYFDKDRGADIFVRAIGGNYHIIKPGEECHFNPLQLHDTMENRTFIAEWLKSLVTINGEPFTADDQETINEAVIGNYKLAKSDRMLRNIAPFLGLEGPGTLAGRLRMWHSDGRYAGLFDNPVDGVDFTTSNVFGFEMGKVLSDKNSLVPVLLYLFHQIQMSLDGTPTIIVLDEAWALIDNPFFAVRIKDWLKTLRKLNAMVVFATQSVEDATSSDISDTLIQQTATQIFLPNPKATETYKKAFMISDREFNLLKTTDPGSRFFLVKQGKDVVVARLDLSGMEDVVRVLSGTARTVRLLDKILAELGNTNPDVWLPVYMERAKRMEEEDAAEAKAAKQS
jgi:type IV secretion system protein VirB4